MSTTGWHLSGPCRNLVFHSFSPSPCSGGKHGTKRLFRQWKTATRKPGLYSASTIREYNPREENEKRGLKMAPSAIPIPPRQDAAPPEAPHDLRQNFRATSGGAAFQPRPIPSTSRPRSGRTASCHFSLFTGAPARARRAPRISSLVTVQCGFHLQDYRSIICFSPQPCRRRRME